MDQKALSLYNEDTQEALAYLTSYSVQAGNHTVNKWKDLYAFLFTRFMDGNVKTQINGQQNPEVAQRGYSEDWYRRLIEETGDKFLHLGSSSGH